MSKMPDYEISELKAFHTEGEVIYFVTYKDHDCARVMVMGAGGEDDKDAKERAVENYKDLLLYPVKTITNSEALQEHLH